MRKQLTLILLFTCLLFAVAGTTSAQSGEAEGGDYFITGTNPDKSTYTGGLEILQSGAETYGVSWQLDVPAYGVGLLDGNVFGVAVGSSDCLLSLYTETDAGLDGRWTQVGQTEAFPEIATKTGSTENGLQYDLQGKDPDGSTYTGTMSVTGDGSEIFTVEQTVNGSTVTGNGLLAGNVFAVGFGDGCSLATYVVGDDATLTGAWMSVGGTAIGTETAQPINISGTHNVEGTNPDGSTYDGSVEVEANNQVHTFTWTTGDTTLAGVGILRGSSVAVGFGGDTCSVASYFQQASDRSLNGLWTVVGSDTVGSELAIPQGEAKTSDPYVGTYDIIGTNYDGSTGTYQGTLEIIAHGDVYQLIWTIGGSETQGVGIASNGILAVGYGGETCSVNAYFVNPNDMRGVWATYGVDTTGTEVLTR